MSSITPQRGRIQNRKLETDWYGNRGVWVCIKKETAGAVAPLDSVPQSCGYQLPYLVSGSLRGIERIKYRPTCLRCSRLWCDSAVQHNLEY